jgi:hypothetical protein
MNIVGHGCDKVVTFGVFEDLEAPVIGVEVYEGFPR